MLYKYRFVCPGRHSELLPSDSEGSIAIIEDLLSQKLCGRTPLMIVHSVKVDFLFVENQYVLRIVIRRVSEIASEEEDLELRIEGLIAEALLQFFGEGVSVF